MKGCHDNMVQTMCREGGLRRGALNVTLIYKKHLYTSLDLWFSFLFLQVQLFLCMLTESKNTLLCPAKSASLKQGAVKCQTEKHKHSLITTFSHFFYKLRMWENEEKGLKKKSAVIFAQTVLYTNAHTRPPCHLEAVQTAQLAHVRRRLVAPLRLRFHQWQPVYARRTSTMGAAWFLVVHHKRSHSRDLCFVFICGMERGEVRRGMNA